MYHILLFFFVSYLFLQPGTAVASCLFGVGKKPVPTYRFYKGAPRPPDQVAIVFFPGIKTESAVGGSCCGCISFGGAAPGETYYSAQQIFLLKVDGKDKGASFEETEKCEVNSALLNPDERESSKKRCLERAALMSAASSAFRAELEPGKHTLVFSGSERTTDSMRESTPYGYDTITTKKSSTNCPPTETTFEFEAGRVYSVYMYTTREQQEEDGVVKSVMVCKFDIYEMEDKEIKKWKIK